MSLHANLSQEAQARLAAQQRASTVSSVIVALLVMAILIAVLWYIALGSQDKEIPTLVSYSTVSNEEEKIQPKKVQTQVMRRPSSPSSSASKVLVSNSSSPISIPVPEVEVPDVSSIGIGDDFGEGWGQGDGWGGGGDGSFFGQTMAAERVVYVIDFSSSMKRDGREALMREEMTNSLATLTPRTKFQMIFFSGPAWIAGNAIKHSKDRRSATITDGDKEFEWTGKGAGGWEPEGKKQTPEWLDASDSQIEKSQKLVQETPISFGTSWQGPLEMALSMDPIPQAIFFMTDGVSGEKSNKIAEEIGKKAKSKGITINTVALMEPKAEGAMAEMAKRTGGQFTIVHKDGKREGVELK